MFYGSVSYVICVFNLAPWLWISLTAACFCLSVFVCVGWSDGAECDSQIQEEIRHVSALQAYLNLNLSAPECF